MDSHLTLRAYVPDARRPWDRRRAGHLLRRAGFGATAAQIDAALRTGPDAAVEQLLRGEPKPEACTDLDAIRTSVVAGGDIRSARGWWLLRLVHTAHPLAARMSLMWHDHFATSFAKVGDVGLMLNQLATFETHALGSFHTLLCEVSKDPAMLVWLDTQLSRRGAPNENYARELFELFAMGVGNYSETDIREAARAFTGWRVREGKAFFTPALHDDGPKTVFGQTGRFNGDDIVALTLRQPACAKFLARRLIEEFVLPEPPASLTDELAKVLRDSDYSIALALGTLLRSEAFFGDKAYRAKIKSPVDFVVGAVRALEARVNGPETADALARMGQKLFEPPSVKGWDGGRNWINSATMLSRINAASALSRGRDGGVRFDAAGMVRQNNLADAEAIRRFVIDLLLDGVASESLTQVLAESSVEGDLEATMRRCVYCVLVSPEYQMA